MTEPMLTMALVAKLAVERAAKEGKCENMPLKSVLKIHKNGRFSMCTYGPLYEGPLVIDEREPVADSSAAT